MKKLITTLLMASLMASLAVTASAAGPMSYSIDGVGDPDYGTPTSIEVVHTADGGAMKNEDVSKNAALIPPGFGSASADALNTGFYLTPNLAPATAVEMLARSTAIREITIRIRFTFTPNPRAVLSSSDIRLQIFENRTARIRPMIT